ncbi:MAG: hypothetical protein H6550_15980 [Chitinophagales bacterium]|nr:hypothetical protein [Chitinophagales bacterium]
MRGHSTYKNKLFTYFSDAYDLQKKTASGWYNFNCPLCGGVRKRGVNFDSEVTSCWTCDYKGDLLEFICKVNGWTMARTKNYVRALDPRQELPDLGNTIYTVSSEVTMPNGYKPLLSGDSSVAIMARRDLTARGFDITELDSEGFGYCDAHHDEFNRDFYGYIIIPFKQDGALRYYIGRDCIGNPLRYKNPPSDFGGVNKSEIIYNQPALLLYDEVGIMEGWADARTWGKDGTATMGWALSDIQLGMYMTSGVKRFALFPDAGVDDYGVSYYYKALKVAARLAAVGKQVKVVDMNRIDGAKDVNAAGRVVVKELYDATPWVTYGGILKLIAKN